ncbi:patatin-like phospholipase family protein [Streptomyces sp. NPDC057694]|uniref:patatin-like phospholipase family protein n=1 Tax=Streptomyces sp. NPDC057694 TaxID=3346216 RepID=UPI0036739B42
MSVAICLSGGGAKGDFEVGVLRLLYDRGVRPDILVSTSVGSVNAVKLAEGEDPDHPERGLKGLERLWASLQSNADMYEEEPWLYDPDMDARVRESLTGRSSGLGISGPTQAGASWGDLAPVLNFFNNAAFLLGDGQALLKSLRLVVDAKSLFNLTPIRERLYSQVVLAAIEAWAATGKKLRMATVALESGNLRYVTESGAVLERDGSPTQWAGELTTACRTLQSEMDNRERELREHQHQLQQAAPKEKPTIIVEVKKAQAALNEARMAFRDCVAAQPQVPLVVDIREGVLASASIPALFRTVSLGDESYVDGGVREIIPAQAAADAGAEEIYVVSASRLTLVSKAPRAYAGVGFADVLSRSMVEVVLNEVTLNDLSVRAKEGAPAPSTVVIAPDVDIHDLTTIDPGLIQINRDYGWMRAADTLDGADHRSERWRSATDIALTRLETWRAENRRFGQQDPTHPADGTPAPDASAQVAIDAGKQRLKDLLAARRVLGGPMPDGMDRWSSTLELHPWMGRLNDAVFVTQSVPASVRAHDAFSATFTLRNTGTTTWRPEEQYRLGTQAPQDNTVWGTGRADLPGPVAPGDEVTFSVSLKAPAASRVAMQWRMVQDGVEWFGTSTPLVTITLTEPSACGQLRADISAASTEIDALRRARDVLDPKNPEDRAEMKDLAKQINAVNKRLSDLRAEKVQLGCG